MKKNILHVVLFLQIDFPAVTVCLGVTGFIHKNHIYDDDRNYGYYMRHSSDEIYYEPEEYINEFEEIERNYSDLIFRAIGRDTFREYIDRGSKNLYIELLDRLENGSLKTHDVGYKL